jgi:hypothetical protein
MLLKRRLRGSREREKIRKVLSIVVCSLRRCVQRSVCLVVFSPSSQIVVNTLVCLLTGGEDYGLFSCLLRYIYVCVAQP